MKSTAAILATAMFVGDRTMASPSLAGAAAVMWLYPVRLMFHRNIDFIAIRLFVCLPYHLLDNLHMTDRNYFCSCYFTAQINFEYLTSLPKKYRTAADQFLFTD